MLSANAREPREFGGPYAVVPQETAEAGERPALALHGLPPLPDVEHLADRDASTEPISGRSRERHHRGPRRLHRPFPQPEQMRS